MGSRAALVALVAYVLLDPNEPAVDDGLAQDMCEGQSTKLEPL